MAKEQFECSKCKKSVEQDERKDTPTCCEKPMKKIPIGICTEPATAEWSRPMDDEEPCDDFRGGE